MKISDLLSVLKCDIITVECCGTAREMDTNDPLMMAAYGNFVVDRATVYVDGDNPTCEISVKTILCKAG